MIRRRPKRGAQRRGVKRIDLSDLRKAVEDRRQWLALAKVFKPDDVAQHYELVMVDGRLVDILVEVETIPDRVELTCSLAGGWGGWEIPDVGREVFVALPAGRIDFRPTIVALAPAGGEIPNPVDQGPAVRRIVLVADEVFVHDGTGGAEPLLRLSEHLAHTHGPGGMTAGGDPVVGDTDAPNETPDGTPVLRA